MKPEIKNIKRRAMDTKKQLLNLKEQLDAMLSNCQDIPHDIKKPLISAREMAWEAFVKEHEKINQNSI